MIQDTTIDCDVLVIGGGGSGLAAAITARSLGRRTVLIEKNPRLGGSTSWSIGSVSATLTPHQARAGIQDSPLHHWEDMPGFAGELAERDNHELRRILCDNVPEAFRWLVSLGVRFHGPMPEPPHRRPRMHNVLPNARSFIYHLGREARRRGVTILLETRASEALVEDGRVVGMRCERPNGSCEIRARGGTILTAGDFTASTELKAKYISQAASRVEAVNPTATGDGQVIATALGAKVLNGDLALGPELRFIPPARETLVQRLPPWRVIAGFMSWALEHMPDWMLRPFLMSFVTTALAPNPALFGQGAILVNAAGERFTDEREEPALALAQQEGKAGYILLDQAAAERFSAWPHFISTAPGVAYAYLGDYRRNRRDVFTRADDLETLAPRLGMPAQSLSAAVAAYNEEVAAEALQGRNAPLRPRLDQAPFYALGPVRPVFVHNEGGLAITRNFEVLGADDRPIPGLYAAGSTGQGGLLLKGHGHHLAWAFTSGRLAGREAALQVTSPPLDG